MLVRVELACILDFEGEQRLAEEILFALDELNAAMTARITVIFEEEAEQQEQEDNDPGKWSQKSQDFLSKNKKGRKQVSKFSFQVLHKILKKKTGIDKLNFRIQLSQFSDFFKNEFLKFKLLGGY